MLLYWCLFLRLFFCGIHGGTHTGPGAPVEDERAQGIKGDPTIPGEREAKDQPRLQGMCLIICRMRFYRI